jgi:hypothetical protein
MQVGLCIDNTYDVICGRAGDAGAGGVCDAKSAIRGQAGEEGKGFGMCGMRDSRGVFVTQTWRARDAGIGGVCDGKSVIRGQLGEEGKGFRMYGMRASREILVTATWPAGDGRMGHLGAAYLSWFSFSTGGSGGEGVWERRFWSKWKIIWELVGRKYFRSCGERILIRICGGAAGGELRSAAGKLKHAPPELLHVWASR